jgi:hypothetical protein
MYLFVVNLSTMSVAQNICRRYLVYYLLLLIERQMGFYPVAVVLQTDCLDYNNAQHKNTSKFYWLLHLLF